MGGLTVGVGMSDQGPRFPEAEAEASKKALALADADPSPELLLDEFREGLAVPESDGQPHRRWIAAQGLADLLHVGGCQSRWPSHSFAFSQARQSRSLESLHPVLDGPRCVAEKGTDLRTGHSLCHQEDAVEPVVVSRVERTPNLILKPEDDFGGV